MLRLRFVICLGLFWGTLSLLAATAQTELRFQWKDDDRQLYVMDQSVRQSLEVFGTRSESETREQELRVRHVHATDNPAQYRIDQHAEQLTYRLFSGDAVQFVFDSRQPDGEDPQKRMTQLRRALAARSQAVWSTHVDTESLKVDSVTGLEAVLNQVEPAIAKQLEAVYAPEYLIGNELGWFHGIPLEPVDMGQSWTRSVEYRLGDGQRLQMDYRYTYVGRELRRGKSFDRIDVVVDRATWNTDDQDRNQLSIKPRPLNVVASNGTLLFDADAGRVESFRIMCQLRGAIQFKLGKTSDTAQLELELNREVQRREDEPDR